MAAIAKMNAELTATAGPWTAGFKQAAKAATSFVGDVAGVASGLAVFEIGASLLKGVEASTIGLVHSQMEAIDATAKLSDTIGISTKALTQLQYASSYSGTSVDDLSAGLIKMNKNLAEAAASGTGGAADALKQMGLNAQGLLKLPTNEALGKIADGLNAIPNAAQRGAAAQEIFGKGFAPLMPLLKEGSEGLKRFAAEADKMGFSFDRIQAAKVEQANDALQKISNIATSIGRQIAIDVAPYITAAADAFSDMAMSGGNAGELITSGIEMIATAVSYAAGVVDLFSAGWYATKGIVLGVASGIVVAIDAIGKTIADLVNLIPGVSVSFTALDGIADSFAQQADEAMGKAGDAIANVASGNRQAKVAEFFQSVRDNAQKAAEATAQANGSVGQLAAGAGEGAKAIQDQLAKLQEQVDTFGKSAAEKLAIDLKSKGASDDQIKQATALQDQLDGLNATKKAHEDAASEAKKYYDQTRTDAEKYAAEIEKINKLQADGVLDATTADRARKEAQDNLDKADANKADDNDKSKDGPKLLQAGSAEAEQFVANIQRRDGADSDSKTMVKQGDKQIDLLSQMVQALAGGGDDFAETDLV